MLTAIISHPCDDDLNLTEQVKAKLASMNGDPAAIVVVTGLSDGSLWYQDAVDDLAGLNYALNLLKGSTSVLSEGGTLQLANLIANAIAANQVNANLADAVAQVVASRT